MGCEEQQARLPFACIVQLCFIRVLKCIYTVCDGVKYAIAINRVYKGTRWISVGLPVGLHGIGFLVKYLLGSHYFCLSFGCTVQCGPDVSRCRPPCGQLVHCLLTVNCLLSRVPVLKSHLSVE